MIYLDTNILLSLHVVDSGAVAAESWIEKLRIAGLKVIALSNKGGLHKIQQKLAAYHVTERDIAKAVKWARKRRMAEKERAPMLRVRGQ
ncbi:MAG: hypothetical protein ABI790_14790 [Betaproteobacteria bacterium]